MRARPPANSRRSDLANERLPKFELMENGNYPVIPAPSMRRRGSNDLEELGMEIRRLEEEVGGYSDDSDVDVSRVQQQKLHQQRMMERIVETRRSKVTTKTTSSKRYEGA